MRDMFDDDDGSAPNDFAKMFEDSMKGVGRKVSVGDKIRAEVLSIGKEEVFVSTGTVDDGLVMKKDLLDGEGKLKAAVGEFLDLYVTQVKGSQIFLSPKPTAKNLADDLEDAFDMMLPIEGRVTETCNGGVRVNVMGKTAFCPISQLDLRRVDNAADFVGKKFEFMITQFENGGRNIVVSRRKLLEEQKEASQASFLEDHKPGDFVSGLVTRMEQFGAFVEIAPGMEGLVHVSEVSWSRVAHPSEVLKIGQEVRVKIIKTEETTGGRLNISLSIKQGEPEPWDNMPAQIEPGKVVEGRVTRCMKFGAFVEIAPGLEGLIPLGEMSYTKRVVRSDELVKEGDRVRVMIKEIRPEDRRISLSLRDGEAGMDPWAVASQKYAAGTVVRGKIERREPYGLFVKLEEGVTGLLPKSKAMESADFSFDKMKIGDEVTLQIGEIRPSERRISLSVPLDPNAEAWNAFSGSQAANIPGKSLGTLADQFKTLMSSGGSTNQSGKKKRL